MDPAWPINGRGGGAAVLFPLWMTVPHSAGLRPPIRGCETRGGGTSSATVPRIRGEVRLLVGIGRRLVAGRVQEGFPINRGSMGTGGWVVLVDGVLRVRRVLPVPVGPAISASFGGDPDMVVGIVLAAGGAPVPGSSVRILGFGAVTLAGAWVGVSGGDVLNVSNGSGSTLAIESRSWSATVTSGRGIRGTGFRSGEAVRQA